MATARRAVGVAVSLLLLALVLAIVGLVMDALRWLPILAAIVLLAGAAIGWVSRSGDRAGTRPRSVPAASVARSGVALHMTVTGAG